MSEGTHWLDDRICGTCGRAFPVLHPNVWSYKRGYKFHYTYFCSWSCMRKYDKEQEGKEETDMMKGAVSRDRISVAMEMLDQMDEKKDPLKYLEDLGYANPGQAYSDLRKVCKDNPKLFSRFPDNLKAWRAKNLPKKTQKKAEAPKVKLYGALRIETPEGDKVELMDMPEKIQPKKIVEAVRKPEQKKIEYQVTGISTSAGNFQFFRKSGFVDWTALDGGTISMSLEEWKEFMKVFPEAMKLLGVEL